MKKTIVLSVLTTMLALPAAPAAALNCWNQSLTVGGAVKIKVGITEEGDPTYFRMRQTGSGRACSNGTDIFNNSRFPWSAPTRGVKGVYLNAKRLAGKNPGENYAPQGVTPVMDLEGKRLGAGQGDRCGGATGRIDRKWDPDIYFTIPTRCQG